MIHSESRQTVSPRLDFGVKLNLQVSMMNGHSLLVVNDLRAEMILDPFRRSLDGPECMLPSVGAIVQVPVVWLSRLGWRIEQTMPD